MADKTIDFAHIDAITEHGNSSSEPSARAGDSTGDSPTSSATKRGLRPPAFLAHMSAEDRQALETRLKRKIDLRLMPAIILMVSAISSSLPSRSWYEMLILYQYILNYIDRWV